MSLSAKDFIKLSSATARLYTPCSLRELPGLMISVTRELISCEHLCYNEFGANHFIGVLDPVIPTELNETFSQLAIEHPGIRHLQEKTEDKAVKISDFVSAAAWKRTSLFNEFFRKLDIQHQLAFLFQINDVHVGFAANRQKKDFSERERFVMENLLPHLRQARENALVHDRMKRAMDQQGFGNVVFDRSGRILFCSQRAQQSIEKFYGQLQNGQLPPELKQWATRALRSRSADAYAAGSLQPLTKAIESATEKSSLTLRISPDYEREEHVLTTDEQSQEMPIMVFKKYGHSTREAEVLSWIAQGKTNPEIAIILNISSRTVAHHVERIFSRIGVEGRGSAGAWALETLRSERMNYSSQGFSTL